MPDLSPDDLDRIRPILELAAARQQAVDAVFAGDSIPARVVNAASWLSGWLQEARDKSRLTSTETDVPRLIGERLLSEANASPARLWFGERNGTLATHELERLEIGLTGLLESIKAGERFAAADVRAVHSAAAGLRMVFGMEPIPSTADAEQQAPAEQQAGERPDAEPQAADGAQYVTLDQIAAIVHKSKRTAEKWKIRNAKPLPPPDVEGGGGKSDEWRWDTVRKWLEEEYPGKSIPENYPADR